MSKNPVPVVAAAFYKLKAHANDEDRVCIFKRAQHEAGAGAWEFPGGKVELDEDEIQALKREIWEELGVRIKVEEFVGRNDHEYLSLNGQSKRLIRLSLYLVCLESGDFPTPWKLVDHDDHQWVTAKQIRAVPLAAADVPLVAAVFTQLAAKK